LPGSDAKLRTECIVFSAHLDHLGQGTNGAMDNASGVATLIEVARALQGKKLKRCVIFAAVTGEESGLLGSKHLAAHPVGGIRVVANLNTDMFLPIIPLKAITVLGLDESELGEAFAAAASRFGVEAKADPQPQRNGFIRSDQYSFIRRGIPSLALKFYAEPGTPEADTMRRWLAERYHGPADNLQQPVERESAARFNEIVAAFVEDVANRRAAPKWSSDSFFRRYSLAR
jgi:Zn-dependent M28 family amino/carboxypeptidase